MGDAIDRDDAKTRLRRLRARTLQKKQSSFRAGYIEALELAMDAIDSCKALECTTVTECRHCRNAHERETTMPFCSIHNRRKAPSDYCNYGEPDY